MANQGPDGTAATVIGAAVLAAIIWIGVIFFDKELLILFGAEEQLLPLGRNYLLPVKFVVPSFLFTQLMSAFLRNDGNPGLATKAVLIGGIFNVFGDYFFVFTLDMGIMGAGLATAAGSVLSLLIMLTHFYVHIFMSPAENILKIAPYIIRSHGLSFLLLLTELIVAVYVAVKMWKYTKQLPLHFRQ